MLIGHSYIFFGEMSIQVLCPFFNRIVCFSVVREPHLLVYKRLSTSSSSDLHRDRARESGSHFTGEGVQPGVKHLAWGHTPQ